MSQFEEDMQKLRENGLSDVAMRVEMHREATSLKEDWLNEQNDRLLTKSMRYRMVVERIADKGDGAHDRLMAQATLEQNNDVRRKFLHEA